MVDLDFDNFIDINSTGCTEVVCKNLNWVDKYYFEEEHSYSVPYFDCSFMTALFYAKKIYRPHLHYQ